MSRPPDVIDRHCAQARLLLDAMAVLDRDIRVVNIQMSQAYAKMYAMFDAELTPSDAGADSRAVALAGLACEVADLEQDIEWLKRGQRNMERVMRRRWDRESVET